MPMEAKEAAVKGTRPWPAARPANRDCGLVKKSLCLLKASRAGSGGRLARIDLKKIGHIKELQMFSD